MKKQWEIAVASNTWKDLIVKGYWKDKQFWEESYGFKSKYIFNLSVSLIDLIELSVPFIIFLYAYTFIIYEHISLVNILTIYYSFFFLSYIPVVFIILITYGYWKLSKPFRYWFSVVWLSLIIWLLTPYESSSILPQIIIASYILMLIKLYNGFIRKDNIETIIQPVAEELSVDIEPTAPDKEIKKEFYFKSKSYKRIPFLLMNNGNAAEEKKFYDNYLTKAIQGLHVDIFLKVRLGDLVEINNYVVDREYRETYRGKINQRHIDFVLCDKSTQEILMAIEYDEGHHRTNENVKKTDREKDRICAVAGLPLLRVASDEPITVEILREKIISYIGLRCADCGESITAGIADYCQLKSDIFKGNNYCMGCQKNYN